MEIKTTTLDKKSDGNVFVIKRQVEETLTRVDVLQRRNQYQFQVEDLKKQMLLIKQKIDDTNASIAECDEMLTQLTDQVSVE